MSKKLSSRSKMRVGKKHGWFEKMSSAVFFSVCSFFSLFREFEEGVKISRNPW